MSYGLKVINSSGTTILDTTMSIDRHVAQYTGSVAGLGWQFISCPGMVWDGTWFGTVAPNTLMLSVQTNGFYIINNSYPSAGTLSYTADIYRS